MLSGRLSDATSDNLPDNTSDNLSDDLPDNSPDALPDNLPAHMSDNPSDNLSDDLPDDLPDNLPDDLPDNLPDNLPDDLSDDLPDNLPDDLPGNRSDDLPDNLPDNLPDDLPGNRSDGLPYDLPDDLSDDLRDQLSDSLADGLSDSKPGVLLDPLSGSLPDGLSINWSDLQALRGQAARGRAAGLGPTRPPRGARRRIPLEDKQERSPDRPVWARATGGPAAPQPSRRTHGSHAGRSDPAGAGRPLRCHRPRLQLLPQNGSGRGEGDQVRLSGSGGGGRGHRARRPPQAGHDQLRSRGAGRRLFRRRQRYTQFDWRGTGRLADYEAIRAVMREVGRRFAGQRIGYPMIGAGRARGNWEVIGKIIDDELRGQRHALVEYEGR